MTWWTIGAGCGVLELVGDIELLVWWGDGTTRAAWLCSQSGALLTWASAGRA